MSAGARLEDDLVLVVVLQAVRVVAVAAVLRAAARLHVRRLPRLGPERAQERRRVAGAGADLHVVGLQQRAALAVPVFLQAEDQLLEGQHGGRGIVGTCAHTAQHIAGNRAVRGTLGRRMTTTTAVLSFALAAAMAPVEPPPREMLPHPSAFRMACTADAVVEATLGDGGSVTIVTRHFVRDAQPGEMAVGATVEVPQLADLPQRVFNIGGVPGPAQDLEPDRVVLFLLRGAGPGQWVPMLHIGDGARGVLWLQGDEVYGYGQFLNPGSYVLLRWHLQSGQQRIAAKPKHIRAAVAKAAVARIAWRDALRIRDREQRAAAVAKWFSPTTSPDGAWWQERVAADLRRVVGDLGELMAKPLGHIVQVDESADAVDAAAHAIGRIGTAARQATPALIARLRAPRGARRIALVEALERLADPRAQDVLRDAVGHPDPFVAAAAGAALHASGGADAARLLVERMPEGLDEVHTVAAVDALLAALRAIAPGQAVRIVRDRFLDVDELVQMRAWMRRLR